ncbi:MAG: crossover junction endodeoxyribonuclease RuvC [Rhodospirillales bacterium]|nr:crossover junction endodeoxyribonuclease RuvC [Alphaproteobacteria bacterium]MCB1839424.1 crossover junction endodeoxyribonuclease RuvC [Alphaproteobacteria bacterium]MCB9977393.1 crossover junction endodeoxyribonuclease RuvC [Rhodospirillales bacterium]
MLILGIDPGLQKTGWGLIDTVSSSLRFKGCGLIKPPTGLAMAQRLAFLHEALAEIIRTNQPDRAAIEETFVNSNALSALKLGQARGVLMAVPALFGLEVAEYAANTIKKSVTGSGHAAKNQIQMMVRRLLPACGPIGADEADALAVAICHAHYGEWNKSTTKSKSAV